MKRVVICRSAVGKSTNRCAGQDLFFAFVVAGSSISRVEEQGITALIDGRVKTANLLGKGETAG